jgi:hypothetical protein
MSLLGQNAAMGESRIAAIAARVEKNIQAVNSHK